MAKLKRPLLPKEDRAHLGRMADKALRHRNERTADPAYAKGVEDALRWLTGADPTPLLEEVTR